MIEPRHGERADADALDHLHRAHQYGLVAPYRAIDGRRAQRADDRFQHGQRHSLRQGLRHVGDKARMIGQRQAQQVPVAQAHRSLRWMKAGERAQQCGLARRIGPDQRHHLPRRDRGKIERMNDRASAIAGAEADNAQCVVEARHHARSGRRRMSARKTGTPIIEVTMPTGSSVPGTSSLLATEASDMMSAPVSMAAGSRKR